MHLRTFALTDLPEILQLFRQTIHEINIRDYTREQVDAWAPVEMDRQRWTERLAQAFTMVAVVSGQVVGFANLEADGHIDCLYTHARYQGQGVATALLAALESKARAEGMQRLFTEASITARPFFAGKGFTVLQKQEVLCGGARFTNYRMHKILG